MPEAILRNFALNTSLSFYKVDCNPFISELQELFRSDPYNEINRMRLCFLFHASSVLARLKSELTFENLCGEVQLGELW